MRDLTEEESTALAQFAPRVKGAIATAGSGAKAKLLGVELGTECQGEPSEAAKVVLLKYLRRNAYDVDAAEAQLVKRLEWQRTFGLDAVMNESFGESFAGCDTILGADYEGRPIVISVFGHLDTERVFGDPQRFLRWRVQMMERALAKLQPWQLGGPETLLQVHDYADCAIVRKDARITEAVKTFSQAMWSYYPETKGKTIFVNFPTIFGVLFAALKTVLPAATISKFVMLGPVVPSRGTLLDFVPPHWLPERYGGLLTEAAVAAGGEGVVPAEVITVAPGEVATRPLPRGAAVRCAMRVLSKDVKLAVASESGGVPNGEWPSTLYDHQGVVETTLQPLSGVDDLLTLTIDNSYSQMTSKTVLFGAAVA